MKVKRISLLSIHRYGGGHSGVGVANAAGGVNVAVGVAIVTDVDVSIVVES